MCAKLSTVCGILSKVRHYLDRHSLMLIYNSLFDSRLRYGILGWGTAPDRDINRLRVLQHKALRFITFSDFRSSITPILLNLNVLPFDNLFDVQKAIFMYNLHYTQLPRALHNYAIPPTHRYPTSYSNNLNYVLPPVGTNRGKSSIKFSGPKIWAAIPTEIKLIGSRKKFSISYKNHCLEILSKMPSARNIPKKKRRDNELKRLFDEDDSEFHFFGFNIVKENTILNDDGKTTEFNINCPDKDLDLHAIFQSDDDDDIFVGF